MPYPDEIVALIHAASLGTFGTDLFTGTKAVIPPGPGPFTALIETGGSGPDYIQNKKGPAYRWPGLQITVHAESTVVAKARCDALYVLLAAIENQTIGGVWYVKARPLQEPHDMGLDDLSRPMWQFNVLFEKGT